VSGVIGGAPLVRILDLLGALQRERPSGRILGAAGGAVLTMRSGILSEVLPPPASGTKPRARAAELLREAALKGDSLRFEPSGSEGTGPAPGAAPNAADLIMDLARAADPGWLRDTLRLPGIRPAQAATPPKLAPEVSISPAEAFLLSVADGSLTVDEIVALSPLTEAQTIQAVFALLVTGLLAAPGFEWREVTAAPVPAPPEAPAARPLNLSALDAFLNRTNAPPQPERVGAAGTYARSPSEEDLRRELEQRISECKSADFYKILGVNQTAGETEVRQAYYAIAKKFHPDMFRRAGFENLTAEIESMFAATTEAYNTLTDQASREEYDRSLSQQKGKPRQSEHDQAAQARESFVRGKKHLEAGELYDAVSLFESACKIDPGKAEYWSYLGRVQEKNSRWRKKAEQSYLKAIELSPSESENYLLLARLYAAGNLARRAHEMFEKVLMWDAQNEEALVALGRKSGHQVEGVKGRLRSMFKGSKS